MKVTGKQWSEFLLSWPDGQHMEDCEIYINEVDEDDLDGMIQDDDLVDVRNGFVYDEKNQEIGSLLGLLRVWLKKQTKTSFVVTCEKLDFDALKLLIEANKCKVIALK